MALPPTPYSCRDRVDALSKWYVVPCQIKMGMSRWFDDINDDDWGFYGTDKIIFRYEEDKVKFILRWL